MVSYYHHLGDSNASNKLGVIVLPMIMLINNLISPFGPYLLKTVNISTLISVGTGIMCTSVFVATYMKTFWGFLIVYAGIMPIGRGLFFYALYAVSWEWFPQCKGFVTGLITAGVAGGSFIFAILSTSVVNPENESPYLPSP